MNATADDVRVIMVVAVDVTLGRVQAMRIEEAAAGNKAS